MSVGSYTQQNADGAMLTLQTSAADQRAFKQFSALLPKAAAAAHRRAINKTLRWLATYIGRAVSRKERIAVAAVRQRLRAFPVNASGQGKLWFGINPIDSSRIGRSRQSKAGVSVAGRRYQGAFLKKVYGSKEDIWIRTASKHFKASDYPNSDVSAGGGRRTGWIAENDSRFPLAKAKVALEDIRPLFHEWIRRADKRLLEILEQELNFELQKYLKRA